MSTNYEYQYLRVEVFEKKRYAIVWICKEPVNSMNVTLWGELDRCLHQLEGDPCKVRGVIFASGLKRAIFTAGNDLNELYSKRTNETRFRDFWTAQTHFLAHLNTTDLITVAAVKGACPAGGCITALSCDYRLMTEKGYIGLNEVLIGVPVPKLWCKSMERLIGARHADNALMTGKMYKPQEALAIGMVNQVVPEDKLVPTAEAVLSKWVRLPSFGVSVTKKFLKAELGKQLYEECEEEARSTWEILKSPKIVALMERYIQGLALAKQSKAKL